MMSRLACVVGIAICTFGYSRCTFVSNPDGTPVDPGLPGNGVFVTSLTLHDSSGIETTNFVMGEPIRFDLEGLNRDSQPRTLQFADAQIYDFIVFDAGTRHIRWRWSANKDFAQVITHLTFMANSSKAYSVGWNGVLADGTQLPAGTYLARGIFVADSYTGDPLAASELASELVNFTVR